MWTPPFWNVIHHCREKGLPVNQTWVFTGLWNFHFTYGSQVTPKFWAWDLDICIFKWAPLVTLVCCGLRTTNLVSRIGKGRWMWVCRDALCSVATGDQQWQHPHEIISGGKFHHCSLWRQTPFQLESRMDKSASPKSDSLVFNPDPPLPSNLLHRSVLRIKWDNIIKLYMNYTLNVYWL